MISKKQLELEIKNRKKQWEKAKQDLQIELLKSQEKRNCFISMVEFSLDIEIKLLTSLLEKYFQNEIKERINTLIREKKKLWQIYHQKLKLYLIIECQKIQNEINLINFNINKLKKEAS